MAAKRRAFPLYFGKRDDDLWEAINAIEEGDRNHEIREALRNHFLGERSIAPVSAKPKKKVEKEDEMKDVNIGLGLIR